MSIAYNYEIISVDQASRVMEVVYTAEGRQTMHISARLPYVGETTEGVVRTYAPVAYWIEQDQQTEMVQVGLSGRFDPEEFSTPKTIEDAKRLKLAELAAWRYEKETSGVYVSNVLIKTDRESQATLTGAFVALSQGFAASIDWKAADGTWATIGLEQITPIARAVSEHVQNAFAQERQYADLIGSAATIEEVVGIVFPQ